MSTPPVLPQELIDKIIDSVGTEMSEWDSKATLRACSLASSRLLLRSQELLFRQTTVFFGTSLETSWILSQWEVAMAHPRLFSFIEALYAFVRPILDDASIGITIPPLHRLRTLTLIGCNDFFYNFSPFYKFLNDERNFPNLRILEIRDFEGVAVGAIRQLYVLEELTVERCSVDSKEFIPATGNYPQKHGYLCSLTVLKLKTTDLETLIVGLGLHHINSPLSITHLHTFKSEVISGIEFNNLNLVLDAIPCVQCLDLTICAPGERYDLNTEILSIVTVLKCKLRYFMTIRPEALLNSLSSFKMFIESIPSASNLARVIIEGNGKAVYPGPKYALESAGLWRLFDDLLARKQHEAKLNMVEFVLHDVDQVYDIEVFFRAAMPRTLASGRLRVTLKKNPRFGTIRAPDFVMFK